MYLFFHAKGTAYSVTDKNFLLKIINLKYNFVATTIEKTKFP